MKNLLATVLLWTLIDMSYINAQHPYLVDTLNIIVQDETVAQVVTSEIHAQQKSGKWKALLSDFKTQLSVVKENIPAYDIFDIQFEKNHKLTIEDKKIADNVLKYKIENGFVAKAPNQSHAILRHDQLQINLYFDDIEQLLSYNYSSKIEDALSKLPAKQNLLMKLYFPDGNYNYSFSDGKLINKKNFRYKLNKTKGKPRLIISGGMNIGIYKNEPLYSASIGVGLTRKNSSLRTLLLTGTWLNSYQKEAQSNSRAFLVGAKYRALNWLSLSIDTPIKSSNAFSDMDYRLGLSLHRKNSTLTFHSVKAKNKENYLGVQFGFGF